jgi:hypothetical protein
LYVVSDKNIFRLLDYGLRRNKGIPSNMHEILRGFGQWSYWCHEIALAVLIN